MIDTMLVDGLLDVFNGYHMGNTAENVASQFGISREMQDAFAASSQQKAEAAQQAGRFNDEIVPVTIKGRKGDTIVDTDEHPRHGTTVESLSGLRPAFDKEGSVTAGNASGLNDGAAAAVLMSATAAAHRLPGSFPGPQPASTPALWERVPSRLAPPRSRKRAGP